MARIEIIKEKVIVILEEYPPDEEYKVLLYEKGELANIVIQYGNIGGGFNLLDIIVEEKTRNKIEFTNDWEIKDYTFDNKKLILDVWKKPTL